MLEKSTRKPTVHCLPSTNEAHTATAGWLLSISSNIFPTEDRKIGNIRHLLCDQKHKSISNATVAVCLQDV